MTKKATVAIQPDCAEPTKSEVHIRQISIQKLYRDHKFSDHSHGRVNKSPIGINHEPGTL
ncbi:MAG TPA: hypothetical protein VNW95_10100 [Mucilaginibacter sp.]|jgi:hypothetical protein|nr:hypothetical protein [Mucilaginibacter sp.]